MDNKSAFKSNQKPTFSVYEIDPRATSDLFIIKKNFMPCYTSSQNVRQSYNIRPFVVRMLL